MEVIIYTRPDVIWCVKLKEWLKKKKISFQEKDVVESDNYRNELIEKSSQMAVPVLEIGSQIIIGFKETEIEQALAKSE